jgi:hypothetical protein
MPSCKAQCTNFSLLFRDRRLGRVVDLLRAQRDAAAAARVNAYLTPVKGSGSGSGSGGTLAPTPSPSTSRFAPTLTPSAPPDTGTHTLAPSAPPETGTHTLTPQDPLDSLIRSLVDRVSGHYADFARYWATSDCSAKLDLCLLCVSREMSILPYTPPLQAGRCHCTHTHSATPRKHVDFTYITHTIAHQARRWTNSQTNLLTSQHFNRAPLPVLGMLV